MNVQSTQGIGFGKGAKNSVGIAKEIRAILDKSVDYMNGTYSASAQMVTSRHNGPVYMIDVFCRGEKTGPSIIVPKGKRPFAAEAKMLGKVQARIHKDAAARGILA